MRTYEIFLGLGVSVLAFVTGAYYQRGSQPDISAELRKLQNSIGKEERVKAALPATTLITQGSGISREELREEIRNALQAERDEAEAETLAESEASEDPDARLTPESITLRANATAVIDGAVQRGRWTASDREQLHKFSDEITDTETQFELYRRVSAALNDGTLKRDLDGMPL